MRLSWATALLAILSRAAAFSTPPPLSTQKRAATQVAPPVATAPPALVVRPPKTSIAGATALVAGTTIGAGILALPAKSIEAGFGPSAAALVGAWVYMSASALLIAEVNVNTACALDRNAVSITSMAGETVGALGSRTASLAYAFIHYALLVAYMLEGGKLLGECLPAISAAATGVPGAATFAAIGGGAMLLGNEAQIDKANSALFIGVLVSFLLLVGVGATKVSPDLLAYAAPAAALPALPVMVLSFTFHNIVPTVCTQLGCDLPKIRTAIVAGSAIPLLMFLVWNGVVLGTVPVDAVSTAGAATFDPLEALRAGGDSLGQVVRVFSLLAIATSFIGFCYGLVDFYADLLNELLLSNGARAGTLASLQPSSALPSADLSIDERAAAAAADDDDDDDDDDPYAVGSDAPERPLPLKAGLYALVLLPPLGVAIVDPSLFFAALDNAGTFGILTLFGILPAAMAWSQRYGPDAEPIVPPALPGGRLTLGAMVGLAAAVIGLEVAEKFGVILVQ